MAGMDKQLLAQLKQTVSIALRSTVESDGDGTWSAATSYAARVEPLSSVSDGADEDRATGYLVIVDYAAALGADPRVLDRARIWLPGDSSGTADLGRSPSRVTVRVGEDGSVDHYEIEV